MEEKEVEMEVVLVFKARESSRRSPAKRHCISTLLLFDNGKGEGERNEVAEWAGGPSQSLLLLLFPVAVAPPPPFSTVFVKGAGTSKKKTLRQSTREDKR